MDSLRPPERTSPIDGSMARAAAPDRPRRLPPGVGLLALVQLLIGVIALLAAAGLDEAWTGLGIQGLLARAEGVPLVLAGAGVVALATSLGLLRRRRWAWVLTMLLVGATLAAELVLWARGSPGYVAMALAMAAAFYLNQDAVKASFLTRPGRGRSAADSAGGAPVEPT